MRRAARAIIINDEQLLVMHRNKFGTVFDTLPGGHVEIGETVEQALFREVNEETSIKFKDPRLVFVEHAGAPYGDQYIYLCVYEGGEPKLSPSSDENLINKLGKNIYEPKWLPLSELGSSSLVSEILKSSILDGIEKGWPKNPLEITG